MKNKDGFFHIAVVITVVVAAIAFIGVAFWYYNKGGADNNTGKVTNQEVSTYTLNENQNSNTNVEKNENVNTNVNLNNNANLNTEAQINGSNTNTTSQKNAHVGVNTNTSVDTSNWLTYTNEKYGFSFKYPSDWVAEPGSKIDNWNPIVGVTSPETKQKIADAVEHIGYCEGCGPDLQVYFFDSFQSLLGKNPNKFTATTLEELIKEDPMRKYLGSRVVNGMISTEVQEGGFGIDYVLYIVLGNKGIYKISINDFDLNNFQLTPEENAIIDTFKQN